MRYFDLKGGEGGERFEDAEAYTHFKDANGQVTTKRLEKSGIHTTRLSSEVVETSFSLPGVREGSVLDISFATWGGQAYGVAPMYFQEEIPIVATEGSVTAHEAFKYRTNVLGHFPITSSETSHAITGGKLTGREKTMTFQASNVPAAHNEPYLSTLSNYLAHVTVELIQVSAPGMMTVEFGRDWDNIIGNLYEAPGLQIAVKGKKQYQDWAKECPQDLTEEDKISWALESVESRVRWNDMYSSYVSARPREVLAAAEGTSAEVNAALLGLLTALGVDAMPIFLSSRDHGRVIEFLPSRRAINSMIVAIETEGKLAFVDATDPGATLNVLPVRDLNGKGIVVSNSKEFKFVNLHTGAVAQQGLQVQLVLNADNRLTGSATLSLKGQAARPYLQYEGGQTGFNLDAFAPFDNFHTSDVQVVQESRDTWKVSCELQSQQPLTDLGGVLAFNPSLLNNWTVNPFQEEQRDYPVEFPNIIVQTRDVVIKLPPNMHAEELPDPLAIRTLDKKCQYRYDLSVADDKLTLSTLLVVKKLTHLPEAYENLRGLFDVVSSQETKLVGISPKL